ncbi:MAG: hypothetical protein QXV73_04405 [Candidatus Micrarchaeia archaeon]
MKIIVKNRKDEKYQKEIIVKKDIEKKDIYEIFDINSGKILASKKSKEIFGDVDLENLYIANVEEGGLLTYFSLQEDKITCPFCFTENNFTKQDFCQHFLSLSEGPRAIFTIGQGTKAISVWEGVCYTYLTKPDHIEITENYHFLQYRPTTSLVEGSINVYDKRKTGKLSKDVRIGIGIVSIVYNQENKHYYINIRKAPQEWETGAKSLLSIVGFKIDKSIDNVILEEEQSNPIWKKKVIGETTEHTQEIRYATITSLTHQFILKRIQQTQILYYVFSNLFLTLTETEYKNRIHSKESILKEIETLIKTLKQVGMTEEYKEKILKLVSS